MLVFSPDGGPDCCRLDQVERSIFFPTDQVVGPTPQVMQWSG
jgi:hypothetical protein